MSTSPSDEILHRMCIGLRVPELRSELHRRGKDESGKRAELVERLVSCLHEEFNLVSTNSTSSTSGNNNNGDPSVLELGDNGQFTAAASSPRRSYHEDLRQPMWGWADHIIGGGQRNLNVQITTNNGRYGVKNVIIGGEREQGGYSGVPSNRLFERGIHWFELKGADSPFHRLCFISIADATTSDEDLKKEAMSGNAYAPEEQSGMSSVSLNATNHLSDENYRRTSNKEGERTLVCLDANERRLSFFINGSLKHLVRDVPIPGRVVVWSKFEGHRGTLVLRTGITPPL